MCAQEKNVELYFLPLLRVGCILLFLWCFCPLWLVKLSMVADAISLLVRSGKSLREI